MRTSHSASASASADWHVAAALMIVAVIAAAFAVARGLASAAAGARVVLVALTLLAGIGAAALVAPPAALAAAACRLRSAVGAQPPALCRGAARMRQAARGLSSSLTESGFDTDLAGEGSRSGHRSGHQSSGFCPAAGSGEVAGGCASDAAFDATGPTGRGADSRGAPLPYPGWTGTAGDGAGWRAGRAPGEPPVTARAGAGGASAAGEPPVYGADGYGAPLGYLGNYRETSYANGNTDPRALRAASDTCDNSLNHGPYVPGDLLAQVEYDLFGASSEGDPLGQFAPPCAGSLRDASAAELATGDERLAREGTVRNDAARAAAAALNRRRDLDSVFREELVAEGDAIWWGRSEY